MDSSASNLPRKNPLRFAWWAITLDAFFFTWLWIGVIAMVFLELMRISSPERIVLYIALFFPIIPTILFTIAIIQLLAHKMHFSKYLAYGLITHVIGSSLICASVCFILFSSWDNQFHINPLAVFFLTFICGISEYRIRQNIFRE